MQNTCQICNRQLGIYRSNNARYCLKSERDCYKISKLISQQIIRARTQLVILTDGKVCKRCQNRVYELSMKHYCKDCSAIMKKTGGYVKKTKSKILLNTNCTAKRYVKKTKSKILLNTHCTECGDKFEEQKQHKKYCTVCKPIMAKKLAKKGNDLQKEKNKKITITNKTKGKKKINSKWLTRGLIR